MRILLLLLLVGCSEAHAIPPKKLPLGQQLAHEASSRPARAVRPQQLIDALAKNGVVVARHRQVLASPVAASYCESLTTAKGLAIALCEYRDEDAAAEGRALSRRSFDKLIPGRTLDLRANSLLTLSGTTPERQIARDTFAQLQPR